MAIRYQYNCDVCSRAYTEQRTAEEPQYVTNCQCGGNFALTSQEEVQ